MFKRMYEIVSVTWDYDVDKKWITHVETVEVIEGMEWNDFFKYAKEHYTVLRREKKHNRVWVAS